MHNLCLITIDRDRAKTSEEARTYVIKELETDLSFVGEGRFCYADWFAVGGRWSGFLSEKTWAKETIEKIQAIEKREEVQVRGTWYGDPEKTKQQETVKIEVEKLYTQALPNTYKDKGLCYTRDQYSVNGYEDDAMIVTGELYDAFLAKFEGKKRVVDDLYLDFADLGWGTVDKGGYVNKKWLVVLDLHS